MKNSSKPLKNNTNFTVAWELMKVSIGKNFSSPDKTIAEKTPICMKTCSFATDSLNKFFSTTKMTLKGIQKKFRSRKAGKNNLP